MSQSIDNRLKEALNAASSLVEVARRYFPKSIQNHDRFQLENTCATIGKVKADWDQYLESRPMALDTHELATVLHGLRMIQCEGRIEGCNAGDCEHFEDCEALDNDEIDELCERLNFSDVAAKAPKSPAAAPSVHTVGDVPPDPEDMNDDRAKWAECALAGIEKFGRVTGECFTDFEGEERTEILKQNISDFLADLAHLCDREGIVLAARIDTAANHYTEETDSEGTQFLWAAAGRK